MLRCFLFGIACFYSLACVTAQQVVIHTGFFITFHSKKCEGKPALGTKALCRRQKNCVAIDSTDWPVNDEWVQKVEKTGAKIWMKSRWLNGVYVTANDAMVASIKALPFVKSVHRPGPTVCHSASARVPCLQFDHPQADMLDARQLHHNGYTGKGTLICVMDDGFRNVHQVPAFRRVFARKGIIDRRDFLNGDTNVYWVGGHGTAVLSNICGEVETRLEGTGTGADFLLARTEIDSVEIPLEMYLWVAAAEWADSMGADILSTSLGYSQFDDPRYDYYYADMDGKTTPISKAAQMAADKGMLVVNSAGNAGLSAWYYVTAPADAEGVLSVGAVASNRELATFSSRGPTWQGLLKPDVCAQGVNNVVASPEGHLYGAGGTSFSCPLISGLAACLMQAAPSATAAEVKDALKQSGHKAANPDNNYGFGVPDGAYAYYKLTGNILQAAPSCQAFNADGFVVYPNPAYRTFYLAVNNEAQVKNFTAKITNMQGQPVLQTDLFLNPGVQQWPLSLSGYAAGVYYLQVLQADGLPVFEQKLLLLP